jgi:hypothetical protein
MAQQESKPFKVGDKVKVMDAVAGRQYLGVGFEVERVLVKNVVLKRLDGVGRGLRVDPSYLEPLPADWHQNSVGVSYSVPLDAPLDAGTVVEVVRSPSNKLAVGTLCVVLQDKLDGNVKLTKLGGDGGRYWPKVPRAWLMEVPLDQLAGKLA